LSHIKQHIAAAPASRASRTASSDQRRRHWRKCHHWQNETPPSGRRSRPFVLNGLFLVGYWLDCRNVVPDQPERASGYAERASGCKTEPERASGNAERASGNAERASGNAERASGNAEAGSGSDLTSTTGATSGCKNTFCAKCTKID